MIGNPYEFTEAQKLLKQMEVEQMNHMSNDQIKKRVSRVATHDGSRSLYLTVQLIALWIGPKFQGEL